HPVGDQPREQAALAGLVAESGDLLAAARALFAGECYVVSDHTRVGNPIVHASPEFEALTRYRADEVLGRDVGFLMRDDTDQAGAAQARAALERGAPATVVVRCYRADGELFYGEQRHYPVKGAGGVAFVVTLVADVTERVHVTTAQEVAGELNASLDGDGRFFNYALLIRDDGSVSVPWASDGFALVTGYEVGDLVAAGMGRFVHEEDRPRFAERVKAPGSQQRSGAPYRRVTPGVTAVYGVVQDVTLAKRGASEMWRLAHVDPLTGLPNHYLLEDRVHQAQLLARRHGQHMALAVLDLDHFRFVNQTFSRKRGDRL